MKYLKLIPALLVMCLSACCLTVPIRPVFPTITDEISKKCPTLEVLADNEVKISEYAKTVTTNYTHYHTCAEIVESWNEWYVTQRALNDH